jgi:ATP phosphoribosyltransferase
MLRMAIPTGRVLAHAATFLERAGYAPVEPLPKTRKLTVASQCGRLE